MNLPTLKNNWDKPPCPHGYGPELAARMLEYTKLHVYVVANVSRRQIGQPTVRRAVFVKIDQFCHNFFELIGLCLPTMVIQNANLGGQESIWCILPYLDL